MTDSKQKQISPYGIRIPGDLKARVQAAAEKAERSLHAEIIHTLEKQYPPIDSLDRATDAVVALLTSKVPRDSFAHDFEDRIRAIISENMPPLGVHHDDPPK